MCSASSRSTSRTSPARCWRAGSPTTIQANISPWSDLQFRQQDALFEKTTKTLQRIGKQAGLSQQAVEDCLKDQALMDRLVADRKYANEVLKVEGTPTFFFNGEMVAGELTYEEMDGKIKSLLKI
jgi:protein-disulfide isomerase